MNFASLVEQVLNEKFDPYNQNQTNPFEGVDFNEVCYFDTETTGLHPKIDQIVEIAAKMGTKEYYAKIHLTPEILERIKRQQENFDPESSKKSIEDLLKMSGYGEGNSPESTEKQSMEDFEKFIRPAKILVAHNAAFDMKMVNIRRKRYGLGPLEKKKVWDTRAFSAKFMIPTLLAIDKGDYPKEEKVEAKRMLDVLTTKFTKYGHRLNISNRLGDLSKAIFGDIKGWHQAMADVNTMKGIVEEFFVKFFKQHYNSGVTDSEVFKKRYNKERKRAF